jgi:hypothetical protein
LSASPLSCSRRAAFAGFRANKHSVGLIKEEQHLVQAAIDGLDNPAA